MYNYNPMQARYEMLNKQKQDIDSQLNMMQTQMNQPPINQTFQITGPQAPTNTPQYDFNGKVANGLEEAKKVSCNSLPVIIMDSNEPKFYMRNLDGTFKTYTFQEYIEPEVVKELPELKNVNDRIETLEGKLDTILNALTQPSKEEVKAEVKPVPADNKKQGGKKDG